MLFTNVIKILMNTKITSVNSELQAKLSKVNS
jgi:hypothetical protein